MVIPYVSSSTILFSGEMEFSCQNPQCGQKFKTDRGRLLHQNRYCAGAGRGRRPGRSNSNRQNQQGRKRPAPRQAPARQPSIPGVPPLPATPAGVVPGGGGGGGGGGSSAPENSSTGSNTSTGSDSSTGSSDESTGSSSESSGKIICFTYAFTLRKTSCFYVFLNHHATSKIAMYLGGEKHT
jgi:hypothetical protein